MDARNPTTAAGKRGLNIPAPTPEGATTKKKARRYGTSTAPTAKAASAVPASVAAAAAAPSTAAPSSITENRKPARHRRQVDLKTAMEGESAADCASKGPSQLHLNAGWRPDTPGKKKRRPQSAAAAAAKNNGSALSAASISRKTGALSVGPATVAGRSILVRVNGPTITASLSSRRRSSLNDEEEDTENSGNIILNSPAGVRRTTGSTYDDGAAVGASAAACVAPYPRRVRNANWDPNAQHVGTDSLGVKASNPFADPMETDANGAASALAALAITPFTPAPTGHKRRPTKKKVNPSPTRSLMPAKPAPNALTAPTDARSRPNRRAASRPTTYNVNEMARRNEGGAISALVALHDDRKTDAGGSGNTSAQPNVSAADLSIFIMSNRWEVKTPSPSQLSALQYEPLTAGVHCCIKNCRGLAFVASSFARKNPRGHVVTTDVRFCRRCMVGCNFTDAKTPVHPVLDQYLRPGAIATIGGMKVVDGSPAEAEGMLSKGSLLYRRLDPGPGFEQQLDAFNRKRPWSGRFKERGTLHTGAGQSSVIRDCIKVVGGAVSWMENEHDLEVVKIWATYTDEAARRLRDHADADTGQDLRAIITLGVSKAEGEKTMTITNRITGRWFTVEISNGTMLIMNKVGSGAEGGLYWHAVDGAVGTYSFCIDMKRKNK